MALNYISTPSDFPLFVSNMSVQNVFNYKNADKVTDRVLKLQRVDANHDLVYWANLNLAVDSIYANQTDMIIRSGNYAEVGTNMYFDGFKYNRPSYINLRDDKKTLVITSAGYYMAILSVGTSTPETSTTYRLELDGTGIAGSFCASQPSRVAFGTTEQFVVTSSSCLFNVGVGGGELTLRIEPPEITSVISAISNLTIIRLFPLQIP